MTGAMAPVMVATLCAAALYLLRLAGFGSIRAGIQAVMHDITVLLARARRRPKPWPDLDFELGLAK